MLAVAGICVLVAAQPQSAIAVIELISPSIKPKPVIVVHILSENRTGHPNRVHRMDTGMDIRGSRFVGLRLDKQPREVVREQPLVLTEIGDLLQPTNRGLFFTGLSRFGGNARI
jgi:hypothetical protein